MEKVHNCIGRFMQGKERLFQLSVMAKYQPFIGPVEPSS